MHSLSRTALFVATYLFQHRHKGTVVDRGPRLGASIGIKYFPWVGYRTLRFSGGFYRSLALPVSLQQQPLKQLVERELQPDEEIAEFGKTSAHVVKTHLVDDRLHVEDIMGKQGDAPFPVI
jgi:hypothetical protein